MSLKFGVTIMWSELEGFRRQLRLAESVGFDRIGIGDSPTTYRELYVALTVAAMETTRIELTSMVQVPMGRHPVIVASSVSSIQELSNNRLSLAFGTGASGAQALGERKASLDDLREYVAALRQLLRGERVTWRGREGLPPNGPRPIDIHITTTGPRSARLAGAIADTAIIGSGPRNPLLPGLIEEVREGAREAGRDPDALEIWLMTRSGIAEDRTDALAQVTGSLAAGAAHHFSTPSQRATVPAEYHDALDRLRAEYDPTAHAVSGGPNSRLMDELGLSEYFAQRYAMVGDVESCREQLRGLTDLGIAGVQLSAVVRDPEASLHRYGEVIA